MNVGMDNDLGVQIDDVLIPVVQVRTTVLHLTDADIWIST